VRAAGLLPRGAKGFTIIEMSIVLVIIGLLVGGVLVGRDLILVAEVQKTGTLIDQLNTAVNTFKDKYNCLPGDCATATNFWPVNGNCAFNSDILAGQVCNGNGDGDIYGLTDPCAICATL
jgi:prepilin-type N-terminal cleavage/methylation domain-containing protein